MSEHSSTDHQINTKVVVPQHIVFRAFAAETVVLNINTGQYHGLNPIAGRMLEVLQASSNLQTASAELSAEFEQPIERIEHDLRTFCASLASRGLIEIHDAEGS